MTSGTGGWGETYNLCVCVRACVCEEGVGGTRQALQFFSSFIFFSSSPPRRPKKKGKEKKSHNCSNVLLPFLLSPGNLCLCSRLHGYAPLSGGSRPCLLAPQPWLPLDTFLKKRIGSPGVSFSARRVCERRRCGVFSCTRGRVKFIATHPSLHRDLFGPRVFFLFSF